MKFRVTMKDPDGFHDSIQDAATASMKDVATLDDQERDDVIEGRAEKLKDKLDRWFEYNEYLTVEVDTDAQTCTVVEVGK
jgi:hypothetical protein